MSRSNRHRVFPSVRSTSNPVSTNDDHAEHEGCQPRPQRALRSTAIGGDWSTERLYGLEHPLSAAYLVRRLGLSSHEKLKALSSPRTNESGPRLNRQSFLQGFEVFDQS